MMVLFVATLVTILASGMISRQSLFIKKAANTLMQSQGYEYALSAEQYAREILFADWEEDKKEGVYADDLKENWTYAVSLPVDSAVIEAQLDDLQSKLNINSLVNSNGSKNQVAIDRFNNLFIVLGYPELKVEKLIDWIDANNEIDGADGAEEGEYLIKEKPYRTSNQPFHSVSELMLVDGVTEEIYQKLLPHVTALPVGVNGINVNTCTPEIIRSLPKEKTLSEAEGASIISHRDNEPFKDINEFKALPEYAGLNLEGPLSINTEFFQVSSKITLGDRVSRLVSVLYRENSKGEMTLMSRDQGRKYIITKPIEVLTQ